MMRVLSGAIGAFFVALVWTGLQLEDARQEVRHQRELAQSYRDEARDARAYLGTLADTLGCTNDWPDWFCLNLNCSFVESRHRWLGGDGYWHGPVKSDENRSILPSPDLYRPSKRLSQ